jgi:oligo-1,6-glucosidase
MNRESKIKEIYANPVGHDVISKLLLQTGKKKSLVTNPLVGNLKLKTVERFLKKKVGTDFFDAVLELLNSEKDVPVTEHGAISRAWWKEAVFYQIYPKSFADSNGDGIGDLRGIIGKLDYLKELGVDALWLSPIYESPMDDNGYDISNYEAINPDFGTMEDFDELLNEVHKRGMKLIMDLVINHTSDEHPWFKEALENPDSKYRNYYFFREGGENPPNNWLSFFGGSAWNHYENKNLWGLHLFSKKQMDLNWESSEMRDDIIAMINRWLDKGVDGFRMDVINYISKSEGLKDGNEFIGDLMGFPGVEKYFYGPHLHDYLKEIRARAFEPHGAFSVGETPGIGMEMAKLITGEERKELDMIFSFDHLETPGHTKYEDYVYDLNFYRDYQIEWAQNYGTNHRSALFYNNHDNPRMLSKVNPVPEYNGAVAKLLCAMQMTLPGTPFVFQGDEMGLSNYDFKSIDDINDLEGKWMYRDLLKDHTEEEAFKIVVAGTRDHTRVLLPWNENAPFKQKENEQVREFYRKLIKFRKEEPEIIYGDFTVYRKDKDLFTYSRKLEGRECIVDCNLSTGKKKEYVPGDRYKKVFSSNSDNGYLGDYGVNIFVLK